MIAVEIDGHVAEVAVADENRVAQGGRLPTGQRIAAEHDIHAGKSLRIGIDMIAAMVLEGAAGDGEIHDNAAAPGRGE